MGFGHVAASKRSPTMLLLARLSAGERRRLEELSSNGVDVALVEGNRVEDITFDKQSEGELIIGGVLSQVTRQAAKAAREAGLDFLVLKADSAADTLLEEGIGLVLAIQEDVSDTFLRTLEGLPLDALLLPPLQEPLTVQKQLELRRLVILSRRPLFLELDREIDSAQLEVLRSAGVAGIVVSGRRGQELVGALRKLIDSLPMPKRRREEKKDALLPLPASTRPPTDDEEDED